MTGIIAMLTSRESPRLRTRTGIVTKRSSTSIRTCPTSITATVTAEAADSSIASAARVLPDAPDVGHCAGELAQGLSRRRIARRAVEDRDFADRQAEALSEEQELDVERQPANRLARGDALSGGAAKSLEPRE